MNFIVDAKDVNNISKFCNCIRDVLIDKYNYMTSDVRWTCGKWWASCYFAFGIYKDEFGDIVCTESVPYCKLKFQLKNGGYTAKLFIFYDDTDEADYAVVGEFSHERVDGETVIAFADKVMEFVRRYQAAHDEKKRRMEQRNESV